MPRGGKKMAEFTGTVRYKDQFSECRFDNDDGTDDQRLTRSSVGKPPDPNKIDLSPFRDQSVKVSGDWQHDWIYEARIAKRDGLVNEAGDAIVTETGERLII